MVLLMIFIVSTDPVVVPPGPMEVLNMRLKSMGGVRGFPVRGAVIANLVNMAANSSCV